MNPSTAFARVVVDEERLAAHELTGPGADRWSARVEAAERVLAGS